MFYNVIIAEDEVNIREGIRDFIENDEGLDIHVSACFNDGNKAIEYIKNHEVDIVITDVKMLNVSGLDIARFTHENYPDIKVIILSGFREFDYAMSAVKFGVQHYLLKPTNFKELHTALFETIKKLEDERESKQLTEDYENMVSSLRNELISDIAFGAIKNKSELMKRYKLLGIAISLAECVCCVVNLEIMNYSDYLNNHWEYGKDKLNESIQNFVESQNNNEFYLFHILNNNEHIKLLCFTVRKEAIHLNLLNLENVSNDIELKLDLHFSVDDEIYDNIWDFVSLGGLLKNIRDAKNQTERIKLLMSHINLGNSAEADAIVSDFIKETENMSPPNAAQFALGIVTEILNNPDWEYEGELSLNSSINTYKNNFLSAGNLSDIKKNLEDIFHEIIDRLKSNNEINSKIIISRAQEFMQEHFSKDIGLNDVANHVFLNPAYFSRFYKKCTNENYSTYLLSLRISHAKKMICNGSTVEQTAKACGYSSARYFLKIFKQHTGLTPSSYRHKLMQEDKI